MISIFGELKNNMEKFSICITTFSKRFSFLESLIKQVRTHTDMNILIAINGDYKNDFDENYRKQVLNLCGNFKSVYPIFFPEQRGLSKLWNTLSIHSPYDWCLLLNDDIEIHTNDIFFHAENNLPQDPDLIRINGSFSHFFIHKVCLEDLGYFDERLLGFGEEDGDIFYRYIEKYNKWIKDVYINGVNNLVVDVRDNNIKPGVGKYSWFNRNFCFLSESPKYKYLEGGIVGCFGQPMGKIIEDLDQYPYEQFFRLNKKYL